MAIDTLPVTTLDDARRLGELVYSTYGLTYHRSFMYHPERLIELYAAGAVTSMIGVDRETGQVVGHQATIRPWFEMADPLPEGTGAAVLEVGLSIVHPDWRGKGVQNSLAVSVLMHVPPRNAELRGFSLKCVTTSLVSQKSAARFMGHPTCLFLAGVPAWVMFDGKSDGPKEPITTILYQCPWGEKPSATVAVPAHHEAFLAELFASTALPRELEPVREAPAAAGESVVRTWFDPARRHGVVRVARSGADLVERVAERVNWMVDGHIEHVTVLLPLTGPAVAAAVEPLEGAGLFLGGVIPDLEGIDTLVLERVTVRELDTSQIQVLSGEGQRLKDYVIDGWRRSRSG